jgi:ribose/xylose/arabinose/galactoside ABC-type transport system permease subunit
MSTQAPSAAAVEPTNLAESAGRTMRRYGRVLARSALLLALATEILLFFLFSAHFLTVDNFRDIAIQSSVIGIVAVATALLLLTGYIDLSVGSNLALTAVVTGTLLVHGTSTVVAVAVGLGLGTAIGAFNGILVSYFGFSTIIVTLGMLTALRGVALSASETTPTGFSESFLSIGNGTILTVPVPIVLLGVAFIIGGAFLRYSAYGRHIYAIGVNKEAAFLSGVAVKRVPFYLFVLTGASAALGGIILASRIDAAPGGTLGSGFELQVLTAVLLGGVSFEGGRGGMFGVFLGVAFLAILQNGLTLLNVPTTTSLIAQGAVLVVAALLERIGASTP